MNKFKAGDTVTVKDGIDGVVVKVLKERIHVIDTNNHVHSYRKHRIKLSSNIIKPPIVVSGQSAPEREDTIIIKKHSVSINILHDDQYAHIGSLVKELQKCLN